jgi:hypothetical protein
MTARAEERPLVVAATGLEARAVRRALPGVPVVLTGMSLSRLRSPAWQGRAVVACGLAGAVRPGVPTGTVLVPRLVIGPGERELACDEALVEALASAARRLGHEPELGPMATAPGLVAGAAARAEWAARGCVGVDMETGLLEAARVATVRVVLDTPERELHPAWARPATALLRPAAWRELPWLAIEGARCARLAAEVLAAALSGGAR